MGAASQCISPDMPTVRKTHHVPRSLLRLCRHVIPAERRSPAHAPHQAKPGSAPCLHHVRTIFASQSRTMCAPSAHHDAVKPHQVRTMHAPCAHQVSTMCAPFGLTDRSSLPPSRRRAPCRASRALNSRADRTRSRPGGRRIGARCTLGYWPIGHTHPRAVTPTPAMHPPNLARQCPWNGVALTSEQKELEQGVRPVSPWVMGTTSTVN